MRPIACDPNMTEAEHLHWEAMAEDRGLTANPPRSPTVDKPLNVRAAIKAGLSVRYFDRPFEGVMAWCLTNEEGEWTDLVPAYSTVGEAMGLLEAYCDKDTEHREWHISREETGGVRSYEVILYSNGEVDGAAVKSTLSEAVVAAVASTH